MLILFFFFYIIHISSGRLLSRLRPHGYLGVKEENQKDKRGITAGDLTKLPLQRVLKKMTLKCQNVSSECDTVSVMMCVRLYTDTELA